MAVAAVERKQWSGSRSAPTAKLPPPTLQPSCRRRRHHPCSVALLPRKSCLRHAACAKLQQPPAATAAARPPVVVTTAALTAATRWRQKHLWWQPPPPQDAMVKVCPCWPLARGWRQVTNLGGDQLIVVCVYSTLFPDSSNSDMLLAIMIRPVSALCTLGLILTYLE